METNRLKQFCTIVQMGSLRKAAALLGISHSGLFKSMKTLETELGYSLFLASGRGIVPSDPGKQLYQRSERFFQEMDRLLGKTEVEKSSVLRMGSFEVFTSSFIGKLLKHSLAGQQIEIHDLVPGRLEEALALERIDFGITYEPMPRAGIEYMRVTHLTMGAYALQGRFAGKSLNEIPFVVPVAPMEGAPSRVKGLDSWPENKIKRRVDYKVDLMVSGLELVRQGLCAIFIPQFVARLHNETILPRYRLSPLALPKSMDSITREVYLVKRESTLEDETLKKVAKALRQVCS